MDNALRLIGIAKKAGRLEVGEEPVGAAARARQAKLVVLAADAADNTLRRATHFAEAGNVRLVQSPYTKAELGMTVGRSSCAMMALTDAGLAASFVKKLALADPEHYGEDAQLLAQKAQKVLQRQKEQRQHEKNLLRAKAKPWAVSQKSGAERRLAEKGEARAERSTSREGTKVRGTDRTRDSGRKRAPSHSKHKKGPGMGTNRNGGRQVT